MGGEREARRIVRTVSFENKAIWKVNFTSDAGISGELYATGNHPFWIEGVGWTAAELLKPGQRLQLADGAGATVISAIDTGTKQNVFNFEVDGFHTYYVGEAGVWVHNTNCARPVGGYGTILEDAGQFAPADMVNAHPHHILFKVGNGSAQQALVAEGQGYLKAVGIDPILGVENLTWAPNVAGQHTIGTLKPLISDLRAANALGASRSDIVDILARHGQLATGR